MPPQQAIPLSQSALQTLAAASSSTKVDVELPKYQRNTDPNSPTIVHISVGNFHRAHFAYYLHALAQKSGKKEWREVGVGLLSYDAGIRDALRAQDLLYTLVERDARGDTARIIASIDEYLYAPDEGEAVIAQMASPACKIVSLTITEGGYFVHEGTGEFDRNNADIQHDLKNLQKPRTSFGYILAALRRRKAANIPPFTVLSCDNMQENGHIAKRMLIAWARVADEQVQKEEEKLAQWLSQYGAFPNCMVDCITPATTDAHRELVRAKLGIIDKWPVTCETFRQWVLEDNFPLGRPEWESVQVQLVEDVLPFEMMKLRLLNASHQLLCYIGMLLGYRTSPQAMADASITRICRKMMNDEVTQLLRPVPGVDLEKYKDTLIERFANPAVADQLLRIGTEGSARIPKFVLPCVRDALKRGSPLTILAFVVASWWYYLGQEKDESGQELNFVDPILKTVQPLARSGKSDAKVLLGIKQMFGDDLPKADAFTSKVQKILSEFYQNGARRTLDKYAN